MINIIAIFSIIACANPPKNNCLKNELDSLSITKNDTSITKILGTSSMEQTITKDFLDLIEFIDSSGFIFDTIRFRKTYRSSYQLQPIRFDKYFLYKLKFEETVPIQEFANGIKRMDEIDKELYDTSHFKVKDDWKLKWEPKYALLEKVESVYQYFYIDKSFHSKNSIGTFNDGLIEEWKFPDANSAREASNDLALKTKMIYVNRGAYICYKDKYMYIFHSRSAGFYTPLKNFLEYFENMNNATIPYKNEQRSSF